MKLAPSEITSLVDGTVDALKSMKRLYVAASNTHDYHVADMGQRARQAALQAAVHVTGEPAYIPFIKPVTDDELADLEQQHAEHVSRVIETAEDFYDWINQ